MSDYNTETVHVKWFIDTGYSGAEHRDVWKFPPGDLPVDPLERQKLLDQCLQDELTNHIDAGYEVQGEEE